MFKSYASRISHRCAASALLILCTGLAQIPPSDPAQDSKFKVNSNACFVRFWNLCPKGTPYVSVERSGGSEGPVKWLTEARPSDIMDYIQVDPGIYTFTIRDLKTGAPQADPLKVDIRRATWLTLATQLAPQGSKFPQVLQIINDTYIFTADGPAQITVVNPVSEVAVEAKVAGGGKIAVSSGQTSVLPNLPTSTSEVAVSLSQKGQSPIAYRLPLDFKDGHHLSIVVIQDRHGRPIPRSIFSGYVYAPPLPPAEAVQ